METFISLSNLCIPLALLLWATIPTSYLNRKSAYVGRLAERMTWLGFVVSAATCGLFFATSSASFSATLFNDEVFGARIDALSLTMLSLVLFLGAVILRFSRNYLAGDDNQGYFFKWMAVTLGSVMALVIAPGLVQFFIAWVLSSLGLHKLLVYFPDRLGTLLSARKKFLVSRIGDLCLLGGFADIFMIFGSQEFNSIFAALEQAEMKDALADSSWIAWLIVFGAILKSAQFPFHTWLPDTMGAPTPVSALMHAGIINAGGFLVIRLSPVLVEMPAALYFLAIIGAVTACLAVLVMLTQTSVKRSLAYSTIAQMGFMFLQCGLGAFHLAMLHIVAHSLYKGHAFLSSGSAVETIKKARSTQPTKAPLSLPSFGGIIAGAFAIVIGLNLALGIQPQDKPGMIVFSVILSMAVAHLIIKKVQLASAGKSMLTAFAWGGAFASLYFVLALGTQALLHPELPQWVHSTQSFEWALAVALFGLLLASMLVHSSKTDWISAKLRSAFYVHALNGFYLNTLANRMCRRFGLVPEKS